MHMREMPPSRKLILDSTTVAFPVVKGRARWPDSNDERGFTGNFVMNMKHGELIGFLDHVLCAAFFLLAKVFLDSASHVCINASHGRRCQNCGCFFVFFFSNDLQDI